jgi:hypothetical protein
VLHVARCLFCEHVCSPLVPWRAIVLTTSSQAVRTGARRVSMPVMRVTARCLQFELALAVLARPPRGTAHYLAVRLSFIPPLYKLHLFLPFTTPSIIPPLCCLRLCPSLNAPTMPNVPRCACDSYEVHSMFGNTLYRTTLDTRHTVLNSRTCGTSLHVSMWATSFNSPPKSSTLHHSA